jgi:hypothetical protein
MASVMYRRQFGVPGRGFDTKRYGASGAETLIAKTREKTTLYLVENKDSQEALIAKICRVDALADSPRYSFAAANAVEPHRNSTPTPPRVN